jgi:hypothetical protein
MEELCGAFSNEEHMKRDVLVDKSDAAFVTIEDRLSIRARFRCSCPSGWFSCLSALRTVQNFWVAVRA